MRRWALPAGLAALAACLITGCSSTVDGSGHVAQSGPSRSTSSGPDFSSSVPNPTSTSGSTGGQPTTSGSPTGTGSAAVPPPVTTCPTVTYPYAHLKFDCISDGLASGAAPDPVWPVNLSKPVEATWAMSEGAGHWGTSGGQSLQAIATDVRTQMLQENPPAYGTSPTVQTTSSKPATVAGVDAWVLQTTFTLNPTFRAQRHLTVKAEKSWIVAMKVGADDVSLWYVTIPDDVAALWNKVPAIMNTIKIV